MPLVVTHTKNAQISFDAEKGQVLTAKPARVARARAKTGLAALPALIGLAAKVRIARNIVADVGVL
eukprot:m.202342 g.202342  ORF g.202342 m.202342 type:complete len:66 (-) comp15359_c0_seq5:15-212(-)